MKNIAKFVWYDPQMLFTLVAYLFDSCDFRSGDKAFSIHGNPISIWNDWWGVELCGNANPDKGSCIANELT